MPDQTPRWAFAGWAAVAAFLLLCLGFFLPYAAEAVRFPFGLEYAEGEIWQQATLIPGPRMYGAIDRYPFIGFEYPPLFHLLVRGVAGTGDGFLAAGRAVSLLASLASAGMIGVLAWRCAPGGTRPLVRALGALVGGLTFLALMPVVRYSVFARVDMLALALSLAGVTLAACAGQRPWLLYLAVLAFVAAVFTKQSFVAAPAAVFGVVAVRDWRLALRAFGAASVLGAVMAGGLAWVTNGGFLRHVIVYNVNRYSLRHLLYFLGVLAGMGFAPAWLAAMGIWLRGRPVLAARRAADWRWVAENDAAVVLAAYAGTALGTTLLVGKSGSAANYFLEFLAVCCVWVGALVPAHLARVRDLAQRPLAARMLVALGPPALLLLQLWHMPGDIVGLRQTRLGAVPRSVGAALLAAVRASDRPVLSDELAVLLLAGKAVPVEPYIFAELAKAGLWDERRLVALIRARFFGAVITQGDPGEVLFDERYGAATTAAILAAYPLVTRIGAYRLRRTD